MAYSDNLSLPPNTILMEIVEIKPDILTCEYRDDSDFSDEDGKNVECEKCDEGQWKVKGAHKAAPDGFISAKECREKYECETDQVIRVGVAKPLALQTWPWDKKTIKYNTSLSDEFTVTYTYDSTNPQKRIAKYSDDNARCSAGDHLEIVWPPYNARVDPDGGNNTKAAGYVKGDLIRVTKMPYGKADVGVEKIIADAEDKEKARAGISYELKQAQHHIDENVDGRKWSDDCGKGGGGGSVWV